MSLWVQNYLIYSNESKKTKRELILQFVHISLMQYPWMLYSLTWFLNKNNNRLAVFQPILIYRYFELTHIFNKLCVHKYFHFATSFWDNFDK